MTENRKNRDKVDPTKKHESIEGWSFEKIGDIFKGIKSGGTPKRGKDKYWKNGKIPFVKIEDLNRQKGNGISDAKEYTTKKAIEEGKTRIYEPGTILLTIYGTLGETGIVTKPVSTNQGIIGLWDPIDTNIQFARYALDYEQDRLASKKRETTQANIGKNILKLHEIPHPPLPEQRKIASVLYNVDQAIQKTEEIIEQTQRVKKGVMQDLFTEGYYEHEEFEDEGPLEKRPADWKIRSLNEVADIEMGSSPKSEYYNEDGEGLPFYQGNNEFGDRNPDTEVWCSDPVKTADKDDILISVRAPVGDLNIAPEKCCIGRGLAGITAEEINRDYLFYHLKERENFLVRISAGSTYDSINSSQLKNLKLKIPKPEEQEKIAEALQNLDDKINSNKRQKQQLQRLKKGLMQDLLTGEVRTKDRDIEVVDAVKEVEG